jgi:hypothetical protein
VSEGFLGIAAAREVEELLVLVLEYIDYGNHIVHSPCFSSHLILIKISISNL